ncbi:MAG TPA: wax ester/triacylglycerol synthase family O-acyltransferase [Candidatus Dormibacteraeota bacterium]|nr:wax ester/triacylglycerol synthase family O-acyltransferase [Candidatus Dormibacteraeota bacterium]
MSFYERLTAQDASFIGLEDSRCHMHVGAVMIFDAAPLRTDEGGIDIDRIRRAIAARLHLVPRFRQRLSYLPFEGLPIWVDDDRFRLAYHVRHSALPRPGDERMLKRLVGRIMSQQLDRTRPLWEMWFVEGLDDDRLALISKTHHCMIDGVAGADLISVIMEPLPNREPGEPLPWLPRPHPSDTRLVFDEARRRLGQPFDVLRAAQQAIRHPETTLGKVEETVAALAEAFSPSLNPASQLPINTEVGPSRRVDWTEMRVADLKAVKNVLGGTLNDVVLATVAGALRRFCLQRAVDPDTLNVRALVPVSVRAPEEKGALGNRITEIIAPLPIQLDDAVSRLEAVRITMSGLKESKQALGGEVMTAIAEWTVPNVLVQAVKLGIRSRPYNLTVTNVPGPQVPLYFLGCQMLTTYPVVPLFENVALVVGLFSYNGGLFWGFTADWETVPDLHDFVSAIEESFAELQAAAVAAMPRPKKKPKKASPQRAQRPQRKAHSRA